MKYTASRGGAWLDKATVTNGAACKIIDETTRVQSTFLDDKGNLKMQDVCKVSVGGKEAVNVSLNKPTIQGLIAAFGDESADWVGKDLSVVTEKIKVAGKSTISLYLVPKGYEVAEENGYTVIRKNGLSVAMDNGYTEDPFLADGSDA